MLTVSRGNAPIARFATEEQLVVISGDKLCQYEDHADQNLRFVI